MQSVQCRSVPLSEQCRMGGVRTSWPSQQQQQPSGILRRHVPCRCIFQPRDSTPESAPAPISRRNVLAAPFAAAVVATALQQQRPASAFTPPVQGWATHITGPTVSLQSESPGSISCRYLSFNVSVFRCPTGQRRHEDKLDGYTFDFPDVWIPVTVRP